MRLPVCASVPAFFLSSSCSRATRSALLPVTGKLLSPNSFRSSGTLSDVYSISIRDVNFGRGDSEWVRKCVGEESGW